MEEAAAVRRAALEAVGDVEPPGLRDRIEARLDEGSLAPGTLAVLSARAIHDSQEHCGDFAMTSVAERGAGVQLIYEGLRLTRTLARDPPWNRGRSLTDGAGDAAEVPADPVVGPTAETLTDADMAVLVADVLVARGFYLLARTEAAPEAVGTVRSFGRDQTVRRTSGDASLAANLERDVFELAAVAGTTAVGGTAPPSFREYVCDLAGTGAPLPLADGLFTDATLGELAGYLETSSGIASSDD
jgi:hypothetical protein